MFSKLKISSDFRIFFVPSQQVYEKIVFQYPENRKNAYESTWEGEKAEKRTTE